MSRGSCSARCVAVAHAASPSASAPITRPGPSCCRCRPCRCYRRRRRGPRLTTPPPRRCRRRHRRRRTGVAWWPRRRRGRRPCRPRSPILMSPPPAAMTHLRSASVGDRVPGPSSPNPSAVGVLMSSRAGRYRARHPLLRTAGSGARAPGGIALSPGERHDRSGPRRRSDDRRRRAPGAAVRARARRARRGAGHGRRRRRSRHAHRHSGDQPVRRQLRFADAGRGRPGRHRPADHRPAGRRQPLLHLRLDDGAGAGRRGARRGRRAGARPAEPARRRRRRGRHGDRGLRVVRRAGRGPRAARPDDRRDGAAGRRRHAVGGRALRASRWTSS